MSPARAPRGGRAGSSSGTARREAHLEWLRLIDVTGPFLSVPVLTREWPDLAPLESAARDRLRRAHADWQGSGDAAPWVEFILRDLLGWGDAVCLDGDGRACLPGWSTQIRRPADGTPRTDPPPVRVGYRWMQAAA